MNALITLLEQNPAIEEINLRNRFNFIRQLKEIDSLLPILSKFQQLSSVISYLA